MLRIYYTTNKTDWYTYEFVGTMEEFNLEEHRLQKLGIKIEVVKQEKVK